MYGEADITVRMVMRAASGLPEDTITNDWSFRWMSEVAPMLASDIYEIMEVCSNIYRVPGASGEAVGQFLSSWIDRGQTHEIQTYQLQAGPIGSPILDRTWLGPIAADAGQALPSEVAGVLSFHGDLTGLQEEAGASRPRARRRGRVFFGPLTVKALTAEAGPKLDTDFLTAIRQAAVRLYDEAEAKGFRWSVHSRESQDLFPVVAGWTDDAPDTQRRRGRAAANRVTYTTA